MINSLELKNFGPIQELNCKKLGNINLIIGKNGAGKTILLKALYSAMKTLENYKRGNEPRNAREILADKLYWTFETEKIGDLVTKGSDDPLSFRLELNNLDFCYDFGKDTTKAIQTLENHVSPRESNSIFFPTKEVLSLYNVILGSRELDKKFGFDDTYLDLARALRQPPQQGNNYREFAASRKSLHEILDGKVEYDEKTSRWQFKKGNQKFSIGVTAEGIKKISILDTLLGNRYLDPKSIIFIDEPESALHPVAISKFLDIISLLAQCGIQFFMASHSYFVVKKLFLISQKENPLSVVILSSDNGSWNVDNLREGMPDNPIIDESIRLYKEEVRLALE
ncbi:AAA family ATPase [Nodosilinea sp. LEGE 07088]|uniref:ATP-binding protein n=1 Tax=Nodosilinea sp. LEGE 07088 TaxID=2777968 RepID=UPI001882DB76|nr:ATP-binding protein [Nodosilinea sp. LEGE 07088]MBE9140050.1 AAA family ATPase [Nodosilinea sp. LEGE 07088]